MIEVIKKIWDFLMKLTLFFVIAGGLQYIADLVGAGGAGALILGFYLLWYFIIRHKISDKDN